MNRDAQSLGLVGIFAIGFSFLVAGCSTTYYDVWQKLGYEKRDILVSRVQAGRDAQDDAKKQFTTTLQEFEATTNFNGGDLEAEYNKLNSAYESCKSRADAVSAKINSIDKVAHDMFAEWEGELSQYQDENLRNSSAQKLADTKARYAQLITIMRKSESSMTPVLGAFHDQVLYLKHNLNAAAIASLQSTAQGINTDVQKLIDDMNASIKEADSFIGQMKS
jgi:chromosome segregation ATPase